jgi:homoisocitrate dehydrogenase
MSRRICLIEGDGIGHEVVPAGRRLLEAAGLDLEFTAAEAGWDTFQRLGTALPEETVAAVRAADAALFGAVSSPLSPVEGYRSPIVGLRRVLDLYANLRPVESQPVPASRPGPGYWPGIDMLIVRENSEGLYSGRERATEDEAVTERVITRRASARIMRTACRLALGRRGHVTVVHKANVLRATCGLFRSVAFEVADEFPEVQVDELLVDTAAMRLITSPEQFDVLVTTNLFGDILSDEAAALVGGLGLAPSANVGDSQAVFEPVHGSAPDIAGRGIANPTATFLAAAMLLDHIGAAAPAAAVRAAVRAALQAGIITPDLGGAATTDDVARAVSSH